MQFNVMPRIQVSTIVLIRYVVLFTATNWQHIANLKHKDHKRLKEPTDDRFSDAKLQNWKEFKYGAHIGISNY